MDIQQTKLRPCPNLPSYASPTQASKRREVTKDSSVQAYNTTKQGKPTSPVKREVFRSFSLSTHSSRNKSRACRRFRLFDLPPEIRDRIYYYASSRWTKTKIDLDQYGFRTAEEASQFQPALLRTSRRLRDEAGVYFFATGVFDILLHRTDIQSLLNWLKNLDKLNRERLFSNGKVTVRLSHDYYQCRRECSHTRPLGETALSGADLMKLTDLTEIYDSVPCPVALALSRWTFTAECPSKADHWRETFTAAQLRRYRGPLASDPQIPITISLPTLVRLRTMLRAIFAILEERDVVLMDEHDRRGRWLHVYGRIGHGRYLTKWLDVEGGSRRRVNIHAVV